MEGGIPDWAQFVTKYQKGPPLVNPICLRLCESKGLCAYAIHKYKTGEIITWYAGARISGPTGFKYVFSRHVYPTVTKHEAVDGYFGAGAWPLARVLKDKCVGAVLNSCRLDSCVHGQSHAWNVEVLWADAIVINDIIRVPMRARRDIEEGEELCYSYNYQAGPGGLFWFELREET